MLPGERSPLRFALRRGEVVRGEPYEVGGRRLTPIARVREQRYADGRFLRLAVDPVGVVEEGGGAARLIPIGGVWGWRAVMLALLFLPLVVFVVGTSWLGRRGAPRAGSRGDRR